MKILRGVLTPKDLTGIIFACVDPKNYSFSAPETPRSSPDLGISDFLCSSQQHKKSTLCSSDSSFYFRAFSSKIKTQLRSSNRDFLCSTQQHKKSTFSSYYFTEQVEICEQYARERGIKIIETLADVENPFLPQKIELPAAEIVIISSLRDIPARSLSSLLRAGRAADIPIHSVRDGLSTTSPHFLPALLDAHSRTRTYWVEAEKGKKIGKNKIKRVNRRRRKVRVSCRRLKEIEISKRFAFLLGRESHVESVLEKFSQMDLGKPGRK